MKNENKKKKEKMNYYHKHEKLPKKNNLTFV